MKSDQEILDEFGKILVDYVYDDNFKYVQNIFLGQTKWDIGKEYTKVFEKLNDNDRKLALEFINNQIKTTIFSFLSIFEENESFKIINDTGFKQVKITPSKKVAFRLPP